MFGIYTTGDPAHATATVQEDGMYLLHSRLCGVCVCACGVGNEGSRDNNNNNTQGCGEPDILGKPHRIVSTSPAVAEEVRPFSWMEGGYYTWLYIVLPLNYFML